MSLLACKLVGNLSATKSPGSKTTRRDAERWDKPNNYSLKQRNLVEPSFHLFHPFVSSQLTRLFVCLFVCFLFFVVCLFSFEGEGQVARQVGGWDWWFGEG